MKEKVLLGLSGGVDSTAASIILREKGYEVIGYHFNVLGCDHSELNSAKKVAEELGIELITEDVSQDFSNIVITNFCSEYKSGRTPNPCIICNPNIKFKKLVENADKIGAKYIATGHYCKIHYDEKDQTYYVGRSANDKKDQSYMLYRLGQDVLSRLIFPLSDFREKEEIRTLVRHKHLTNSEKKDSQEICFIDDSIDYAAYVEQLGYRSTPGKFIDKTGKVLGQHKGILHYTIGQRKGLGIALGKAAYVVDINSEENTVTLGDNEDLFTKTVVSRNNVFTNGNPEIYHNREIDAKVRYSVIPSKGLLKVEGDKVIVEFSEVQRAVTPGQSIVFYLNNRVIGGGFIE